MRKRCVIALLGAVVSSSIVGVPPQRALAARATICGSAFFGNAVTRLEAIESDRDMTMQGVARRSAELDEVAGSDAEVYRAISAPCANAGPQERLHDVATVDELVVWSHLLALRAIDAPIYPKPYSRSCYLYDLSGVQTAFIDAWTARVASRGTPFTRDAVWQELGRDPLFPHISSLASTIAHRIGVRALPTLDSDEGRWIADNNARHRAFASELEPGTACGPKLALWGFPPVEQARKVVSDSIRE